MKPKKIRTNRLFAFHTFLFGIYPVLALYSFNSSQILLAGAQKAVITAIVITIGAILVNLVVLRSWEKAALAATLIISLFFSYGHVFNAMGESVRHRTLIAGWGLIYVIGLLLLLRLKDMHPVTRNLNLMSLILVALVTVQILSSTIQSAFSTRAAKKPRQQISLTTHLDDRDVYYILVDALGRQDVLAEDYNVDVSEFIAQLTDMGFYIPNCTQSNYDKTVTSLTSTLNMNYLDALGLNYEDKSIILAPTLRDSLTRAQFENMGYEMFTFKSLYPWLDITDVAHHYDYFETESASADLAALNFQYLFLRTTALRPLVDWLASKQDISLPPFWANWVPVGNSLQSREYRQYQQNVYALEMLEKIPDLPGKKFVYAHLYITHQPFVFYPDGRFHPGLVQSEKAYADQVLFAEVRLLQVVRNILEKSKVPPVIIIQGDHSYSEGIKRPRIFNAYYLPDGGHTNLYETITPVNTFRVVFNTYFGGQYELLPDISRYGDADKVLREVPSSCVNGTP